MKVTIDFSLCSWQEAQELAAKLEKEGIGMPNLEKRINTVVEVNEAQWAAIEQEQDHLLHKIAWPTSY